MTILAYVGACLLLLLLIAAIAFRYYGWEYAAPVAPAIPGTTKIVCIGDSITCGALLRNRKQNCYPAQLERMLGNQYSVRNFGVNGHTLQKKADKPYWGHKYFKASSEFEPDIVLVMLGTNDATKHNWKGIDAYTADYRALLEHYLSLPCHPVVYAMTPPTEFWTRNHIRVFDRPENQRVSKMAESIKGLSEVMPVGVIDINAATKNHPECFRFDGIHPDANGAKIIAETAYTELALR